MAYPSAASDGKPTGHAWTVAVLSFIALFGLSKAVTNLAAGRLADRHARRSTLLVGWLVALPIPYLILAAKSWWLTVAANALLGINQGLAWSMTVIMKIDLVGPMRRGLAMGLNEFAGYLAVGLAGLVSGIVAAHCGLREETALLGFIVALSGLTLSFFVCDTSASRQLGHDNVPTDRPGLRTILARSMWSDANMFSVSQAGFVNNQQLHVVGGRVDRAGVGTTLVYPTCIAAVGDIARPTWRGVAVGVYRLWRDLGYVAGALLAGILTDAIGVATAINVIGALTFASGLLVWSRFEKR
jgi:predicted MFS family arabinose efflux permease